MTSVVALKSASSHSLLEQDRLLRVLVVALGQDELADHHVKMLRSIRCLSHAYSGLNTDPDRSIPLMGCSHPSWWSPQRSAFK